MIYSEKLRKLWLLAFPGFFPYPSTLSSILSIWNLIRLALDHPILSSMSLMILLVLCCSPRIITSGVSSSSLIPLPTMYNVSPSVDKYFLFFGRSVHYFSHLSTIHNILFFSHLYSYFRSLCFFKMYDLINNFISSNSWGICPFCLSYLLSLTCGILLMLFSFNVFLFGEQNIIVRKTLCGQFV